MRKFVLITAVGLTCWLAGARFVATQETEDAAWPMPKPSPEHAMLAQRVGTWDADFKMWMEGEKPMESKAVMKYEKLGDFWVIGRYEGDMMGMPFHGMEISGYDPETKKLVSYWLDSTGPTITEMHGTWDAAAKTTTMRSTQAHPNHQTGKEEILTSKTVAQDPNVMVYSMSTEGVEKPTMEITYKRRK
jgi:hypothetical protein